MTECSPCGKFFSSTTMFDKHRVGSHEPLARRCLETHEMELLGMVEKNGVWTIPKTQAQRAALDAVSRPRGRALTPREG